MNIKIDKLIKFIAAISIILVAICFVFSDLINFNIIKFVLTFALLCYYIIPLLMIIYVIYWSIKKSLNKKVKTFDPLTEEEKEKYKDERNEDIKKIMPEHDLKTFIDALYNKYVETQNALTEFDYNKLRELCTDELYNTYKKQLEIQKLKNEHVFKKDFKKNWARIVNVKVDNENIIANIRICVSYDKFTINATSKEIIKGDYDSNTMSTYDLVFVKSVSQDSKIKCPNCGSSIEFITSIECEYCGSTIIKDASDFVLSKNNKV